MQLHEPVVVWLASMALISCSGSVDDTGEPPVAGKVEIFSWWVNPGESEGLVALIDEVHKTYPGLDVENRAGDITLEGPTLEDCMLGRRGCHPPGTFQVHGGKELIATWVSPSGDDFQNNMEPIDFLYDSEGWRSVLPQRLLEMLSYQGSVYSIPVNVHKGNVLWYNRKIFNDLNIKVPTTWNEFFTAAAAIKTAGYVALALGGQQEFSTEMILDSAILGKGGAAYYNDFFAGRKDPASDPELRAAVDVLAQSMDYVQPNPRAMEWSDAAQMLVNNQAAMTIMGDWCKRYLDREMTYGAEGSTVVDGQYGAVAVPETAGSFVVVTDTFGLPQRTPYRINAIALLEVFGSRAAADALNPIMGSIPARTDADRSNYDDFMNQTMDDYLSAANSADPNQGLVPSLAHGSAASPAFMEDLGTALVQFLDDKDGDKLIQAIATAYPSLQE